MNRPSAGGFLGLTALRTEGYGGGWRRSFIGLGLFWRGCHFAAYYSAGLAACGGHPLSGFAGLLLKGSMSLDFRVASLPYKSSSFATPIQGAEQPVLCFVTLMR